VQVLNKINEIRGILEDITDVCIFIIVNLQKTNTKRHKESKSPIPRYGLGSSKMARLWLLENDLPMIFSENFADALTQKFR
jgi:hypothetical protein